MMNTPGEMTKGLSVVIPNYNGEQLLGKNLPLLYQALTTSQLSYEIIIPDDASTDGSVAFLRQHYPDIRVVEHRQNQGFATNINAGIRLASKDLVFLLNSDIELTPDYFQPLLAYFDDPQTFGVTGRIIAMDSDTIQDGAKYPDYSFGNIRSTLNFIPEDPAGQPRKVPTFFMSGANILADRQKLWELGGFNELFSPFYSEDVDLGLRAWRLGYACYYEHQAVCRHPNSVTINKYNSKRKVSIIAKRNKFYLHYLHLQGLELYYWFGVQLLKTLGRLLVLDQKHLKSFRLFWESLPAAAQAKQDFAALQQKHRVKLSLRDVRQHLTGSIAAYRIRKF
jgi:GT2 family glycosyltransferase